MDNFFSSFHEISAPIKVCLDIINIILKEAFRLTKFVSNNRSILQILPTNNISPKLTEINLWVNLTIERPLGILWNAEKETFHIKYALKLALAIKQGILSLISSIFYPLGLIAPALIEPK